MIFDVRNNLRHYLWRTLTNSTDNWGSWPSIFDGRAWFKSCINEFKQTVTQSGLVLEYEEHNASRQIPKINRTQF